MANTRIDWKTVVRGFMMNNDTSEIQKQSFNHFVNEELRTIISDTSFISTVTPETQLLVQFGNIYIERPTITSNNSGQYLFPQDARYKDHRYEATVYVDIYTKLFHSITNDIIETNTHPYVALFKFPAMVRSIVCNLSHPSYSMPDGESFVSNESETDYGGYFIINGKERVIVSQETINMNHIFVFEDKKSRSNYVAEIRSIKENADYSVLISARLINGVVMISLPKKYMSGELPLGVLFRALGLDISEVMNRFLSFSNIYSIVKKSVWKYKDWAQEDAIKFISKYTTSRIPDTKRVKYTTQILENEIFPHLGLYATQHDHGWFLALLTLRLLQTTLGNRFTDDRDHINNKRVEAPGALTGNLVRSLFKRMIRSVQQNIEKKHDVNVIGLIQKFNLTNRLYHCFTTGNWGIQKSKYIRKGVTQIMSRLSYAGTVSHLRRVVVPIEKNSKNTDVRHLHPSSFGFTCGVECFDPDTKILLWDRTIKYARDIVVGDILIDEHRKPTRVKSTCSGVSTMYDVIADNDAFQSHRVSANHILSVKSTNSLGMIDVVDIPLQVYLRTMDTFSAPLYLYKPDGQLSTFHVKKHGEGDFVGWALDGSQRFLLSDSTVSHNCPEGQQAGIVKSFAMAVKLSYPISTVLVIDTLNDIGIDILDYTFEHCGIFVNGIWIGCISEPKSTLQKLKELRSNRIFHQFVSFGYDPVDNELHIHSDGGRMLRAVFNLKCNDFWNKLYTICDTHKDNLDVLWRTLEDDNVVVWVDGYELDFAHIAMTVDEIQSGTDFLEIHPSLMMGTTSNLVPFSDHNQAPRNLYSSAMLKQSIGNYAENWNTRYDTHAHVLHYPQKRLVSTFYSDVCKMDENPAGVNLVVAIACYNGYNMEDSVIINKSAIDRGLFQSTSYRTTSISENKKGTHGNDRIEIPPLEIRRKELIYSNLDENGIVCVGTKVGVDHVLVGRVFYLNEEAKEDTSLLCEASETGVVDSVLVTTNASGYKHVKIRIRSVRIPEIGDKVCCYTPDHEILTRNRGWIKIHECSYDDTVYTLNPVTHSVEYYNPINLFEYDIHGKVYTIRNQFIDLKVTTNHCMYVKTVNETDFELVEAIDLLGKKVNYKKNAVNTNTEYMVKLTTFPVFDMDAWLLFLGTWYRNGCTSKTVNDFQTDYITAVSCSDSVLSTAARSLGLVPEIRHRTIVFYEKRLGEYLYSLSVSESEKSLPDWVWNLSERQSKILLSGLVSSGSVYTTCSPCMADDTQRLALMCGWSGTITSKQDAHGRTQYGICIIKTANEPLVNQDVQQDSTENYQGKVYCIEVPNHIVYIRRNGKSVWCGNSMGAQKGTVGIMYRQEDMPWGHESQMIPDIILNPHSQPSRMTIGMLIEMLCGKECSISGRFQDCTAFCHSDDLVHEIADKLKEHGYGEYGDEVFYNGFTGEPFKMKIFMGVCYYQRLKHLVSDKMHARGNRGNVQALTRQPAEGRSRDGGLRFGEMERDCMISHGASIVLKERMHDLSDPYKVRVCKCGSMVHFKDDPCAICGSDENRLIALPYSSKLLVQDLNALGLKVEIH